MNRGSIPQYKQHTRRVRKVKIHKQIGAVYGNVMNRQNVTKWFREFFEGRTDVHNEQRSGRPSLSLTTFFRKLKENFVQIDV
jgi:hypothetical protein